jgi:hypothetical protein
MKHLVDRGLGVRSAAFEVVEALMIDDGGIAELVEQDIENFIVTAGQGLEPCALVLLTVPFEVGKDAGNVVIVPPNSKTKDPGGPAPGHAAFTEARLVEIAAATGLEPGDFEVENVSINPNTDMKPLGVVDFSFLIRVPDPSAEIGVLKKACEEGQGMTVPVRGPVKETLRPLDVSGIQEVAMVTVRMPLARSSGQCCTLELAKKHQTAVPFWSGAVISISSVCRRQISRAAERMEEELLPHMTKLIPLVKALLGDKPVEVEQSKEAKNSRAGHKDMDLQVETRREAQAARLRFQQKCMGVIRGLATLPEISECASLTTFVAELESSPFASMWLNKEVEEGVPETGA